MPLQIVEDRSIPDSEHNLDAALNYSPKRRPQFKIEDGSAVEESHNLPQDKKFSIQVHVQLFNVQANHSAADIN